MTMYALKLDAEEKAQFMLVKCTLVNEFVILVQMILSTSWGLRKSNYC